MRQCAIDFSISVRAGVIPERLVKDEKVQLFYVQGILKKNSTALATLSSPRPARTNSTLDT